MKRLAIDTNIYVAFKNNSADVVDIFRACDVIGVDIAVIAELYAGFSLGNKEAKNRRELEAFLNAPRVEVLAHDLDTAEFYALIVKKLKAKGKPIPSNDIWIAANALKQGMALYSFDKHFDEIDGLLLVGK
ncbi:MAG TPA: type II toxin-antitoxin system VapC family toxin [Nitrospirota bacterium]|nr:type II toxin-antitoxin system VapC family toxin [Nitrospirota bacterium]